MTPELMVSVALAVLVGLTLGALGGGGSMLTLPILVSVMGLPPHRAIATSLVIVGTASVVALVSHARRGAVRWRTGVFFAAASALSAYGAGRIAHLVPGSWLLVGFALTMLVSAVGMLRHARRPRVLAVRAQSIWIPVAGFAVGGITGLVGAGGGFLIVPALALFVGLSMRDAIGTSLFVITVSSLAALAGHLGSTDIDPAVAGTMSVATALGAIAGVAIAGRIQPDRLRRAFGLLVLGAGGALAASAMGVSPATAWIAALAVTGIALAVARWTRDPPPSPKGRAMILRQLFDSETSTYTYLLADPISREAVLIDPVLERLDRDLELLRELDLVLVHALDTHVHADHLSALGALRERTGAKTVLGRGTGARCADTLVSTGDRVPFGDRALEVRETPGHTEGCVTYVLDDHSAAFTGDALLIRGTGRTDFQQGNARALYHSIHERIFTLPDDTLLYPGHDYHGRSVTTVAEEKRHNPRLGGDRTVDEFVETMSKVTLEPPKRIAIALPANASCGRTDR